MFDWTGVLYTSTVLTLKCVYGDVLSAFHFNSGIWTLCYYVWIMLMYLKLCSAFMAEL